MATRSGSPEAVWPGGSAQPRMPYSPAIKAGPWVFIAGQMATDFGPDGLAPECRAHPDLPYQRVDQRAQSTYVLETIRRTCEAAGADLDNHSLRIYQWFVSPEQGRDGSTWPGDEFTITPYVEERARFLTHDPPASTGMGVRNLLVRDAVVEVDLILKTDAPKEQVHLDGPTSPAGHSQAVVSGDWVFTSGELATDFVGDWGRAEHFGPRSAVDLDARTPSELLWLGQPAKLQTRRLLERLERILEAAGSSMRDVVHATIYYSHPRKLAEIEEAWREWFPEDPPARTAIPQMGIGTRGCDPEIALVALRKDGETKRQSVIAAGVPEPLGHEPHAVRAGDLLFLSTQIAADRDGLCPGGRRDPAYPWYGLPARAQMAHILENASRICEAAGTSLENVCRRQAFHTDFRWFAESFDEWVRHFPGRKPASRRSSSAARCTSRAPCSCSI